MVNGRCYTSHGLHPSKKQAEQSAARRALDAILQSDIQLATTHITLDHVDPPPSYAEATETNAIEHLPSQYSHIEQHISVMVGAFSGRIRKIWSTDSDGLYKFDITGGYRHCEIIGKRHGKRTIYFMVDPANQTYYQMCYDPQCAGKRSVTRTINIKHKASVNENETSMSNAQLLSKIC